MRKKVLRAALMAAVVAVAGYGVCTNQTKEQAMSDIMLENAEALAGGEVEIEAICMGPSGTCIVYSDGYKIDGRRVA